MRQTHHHVIDKLAFINGLISGVALYPQVWFVISTKAFSGISSLSFGIISINSGIWFLYGIHRKLPTLSIASFLNAIAAGVLACAPFLF